MNRLFIGAAIALIVVGSTQTQAVELLISGDFEVPVGLPQVEDWILEESITGSPASRDTAELSTNSPEAGIQNLFLKPFNGNGALDPNQGNFLNDNLPGGDVAGLDFLAWQRGISPTPGSQADLITWENNYGRVGGQLLNAVLSQTVPGVAGETYTFSGFAKWEDNYAGGVGTLDPSSPLGAVATPTTNAMHVEFLNSSDVVIGSHSLDLLDDGQFNDAFSWIPHEIITDPAPVGTAKIRVSADAKNMVYNLDPLQSAFYDSFSLTADSDPNMEEMLSNPGLDKPVPTALEFWDIFEIPIGCCSGEVLRSNTGQLFANHTDGGTRGVWLSAFFGSHPIFELVPVTGLMSQTVEAVPGGSYDFAGWAKFEAGYAGGVDTIDAGSGGLLAGQPSPTETLIVLEFLDPNGVVINPIIDFDPNGVVILDPNSPNIIDVKTARQALCSGGNANDQTCGPALDGWTQHALSGIIAPAGTAFARLTAGMLNGVFNIDPGQSAFFDDFSLQGPAPLSAATSAVPEPTTATGLAIGALLLSLRRRGRRTVS